LQNNISVFHVDLGGQRQPYVLSIPEAAVQYFRQKKIAAGKKFRMLVCAFFISNAEQSFVALEDKSAVADKKSYVDRLKGKGSMIARGATKSSIGNNLSNSILFLMLITCQSILIENLFRTLFHHRMTYADRSDVELCYPSNLHQEPGCSLDSI